MLPPEGITKDHQSDTLSLLGDLNRIHQKSHPAHADLEARIESYELAFRMQAQMPGAIAIDKEPEALRRSYGIGAKPSDPFGRRCLLARRLVERGVRFVQVISSGWDSHDDIATAHANRMRAVDQPIAGLLQDLKQRGLLDSTLVVWAGEFGRSPDNGMRQGGQAWGRDHNATAMPMWFAGGGVKRGAVVGATDDIGQKAVAVAHPVRNVHVTILHLLGLNDAKLTYFHAGRFKQLSQIGGAVIRDLLA